MAINALVGSALIGGGSSLLGSALNYSAQKEANETNIMLAREQRDWEENMWNKSNEYNSPKAQIERMREAGLNPALMYSQGNVGNTSTPSAPAAARVQPVSGLGEGIIHAGDMISNALMQNEMLKQQRAQTKLLEAKAIKEQNSTMPLADYLKLMQSKYRYNVSAANYQDSRTTGQDIYNQFEPHLLGNQARHGELSNSELNVRTAVEMGNFVLNVKNYELRKRMTDVQVEYYYKMIKLAQQKYNVINEMNPKQLEVLDEQIANIAAQTKHLENVDDNMLRRFVLDAIDTSLKHFENFLWMETSDD